MMLTQAVILAAGTGTRMMPFSLTRPKALLPLMNEPLLRHLYRALEGAGIREVTGVTRAEYVPLMSSVECGALMVRWIVQPDHWGSGYAAMSGQTGIPSDQPVLFVEGDIVVSAQDVRQLMERIAEGTDAAILLDPLGAREPYDWTIAEVEEQAVLQVWGHPREGEWRVSGAYALSPAGRVALAKPRHWGVQVPVGGMPHQEYDMAEVVNTLVAEHRTVAACIAQDNVENWDKPWHILEGNWRALASQITQTLPVIGPGSDIDATAVIRGAVQIGAHSHIGHGAIIEGPVLIGDDCRIDDYAKLSHAVIGHGSIMSHTAEFLGWVLMNQVYLMHNCELYGVFGDNVDIGAGTVCGTLRFDDRHTRHRIGSRGETPVTGSNAAYMGDFSRTGVNVVILPGKHIGPYTVVGPGVVVNKDIAAYSQVLLEQSWHVSTWGPERYGW